MKKNKEIKFPFLAFILFIIVILTLLMLLIFRMKQNKSTGNISNMGLVAQDGNTGVIKLQTLGYSRDGSNPFYLYGGPGLGKTHLVQAIGNELLKSRPELKVAYVPTNSFYNEFIEALGSKQGNKFTKKSSYKT